MDINVSDGLSTFQFQRLMRKLDKIESKVERNFQLEVIMATEMEDLAAAVERDTTVDQSAITLLNGLKAALDAAGTDRVKLAALSAQIGSNTQALADAVTANTPAEPPPPPPPTV